MALKTFRVCHSSELPIITERDSSYVYFLYDKLALFNGQNMFYDHYAIVEEMPNDPIDNMWYICFDGIIRSRIDYNIVEIAEIEDPAQLELLTRAGTVFFYEARRRYLDTRRQVIELPYLNGSYQMTVNLANNIKLDENTVVAFNPETSEFEVSGKVQDYDLIFTHDYKGLDSDTVKTMVTDHMIKTEVKISQEDDNIIKVHSDGLYASVHDRVPQDEFDGYKVIFEDYKDYLDDIINMLDGAIREAGDTISEEAVRNRILSLLEDRYPGIRNAIENFDQWAESYSGIEDRVQEYSQRRFKEIMDLLPTIVYGGAVWEELGD